MCVEQIGGGKVLYKEGAQPGTVMTYSGGMGGEGRLKSGGYMCNYGWFTLLYDRQKPIQHRKANILQLKNKIYKKKYLAQWVTAH